jgi:hypothetical protein
VYLLVSVDDIQIASKKASDVEHVKQLVLSTFKGRDLGETQFFLQKSVHRDRSQQQHGDQSVQAGWGTACPKSIPMITGTYNDPIGEKITDPAIVSQYRSLVGAVMHTCRSTSLVQTLLFQCRTWQGLCIVPRQACLPEFRT